MALTPEQVHDLAVHHRIALGRYSNAVVRKIVALLNRNEQDILARLARTSNETVGGQRLEALLADVRQIQRDGWSVIRSRMNGEVGTLAPQEEAFAARLAGGPPTALEATFSPLPTETQLIAAVNARPFQGRFLAGWLDDAETGAAALVRDAIRQGFVDGQTTDQIVRRIRGTSVAQYQDGLMEVSRRRAETMVRTALTHTSNVAHQMTFEAMGVTQWRFVATLDARTSLICISLHGQVFKVGEGPQPPRHPNCRSTSVPMVDEIPGVKPFAFPSYQTWLKGQPAAVQDDVLGPTKAKLFRDGGLGVERFVDNKGKVLTLDQLKARDASAFAAAGLN